MKKKKTILCVATVLLCLLVFVSCGSKLKGSYTNNEGFIQQSFIFEDGNKVKVSAFGLSIEGDYVIEDGKIRITYSLEDLPINLSYDWEKSFEKKGDSIFIDGTEFVKN